MRKFALILGVTATLVLGSGCFSYGNRVENQDVTPQSYEERTETPVFVSPVPIPTPDHPALQSNALDGAKTHEANSSIPAGAQIAYARTLKLFKGQGIHYFNEVKALRVMSPFGVSAGEVITEAAKKPATISAGDTPTISMHKDGSFKVGKGEETQVVGTETGGTITGSIITRLKDWGLIALIGAGVLLVLPLIFPVLGPIFSLIWSVVTGIWTWVKSLASTAATHIQAAIPGIEAGASSLAGKVVSEWRTMTTSTPVVSPTTPTSVSVVASSTTSPVVPVVPPPAPVVVDQINPVGPPNAG
jgi:hypothetical protein